MLKKGFTVVELIIVAVVIGILATITIVSYTGSQQRAEYAKAQTDLKHINDAINIYKAQKGSYPVAVNQFFGYEWQVNLADTTTYNENFLSTLVTEGYLDKMPKGRITSPYHSYIYRSDGTDYKLLRLGSTALPSVELSNTEMIDPVRPTTAWGYWSSDTVKTTW